MPEMKNVLGKALWGNYQTPGNHSHLATRKFEYLANQLGNIEVLMGL